jgi:hypothetical protein
MMEAKWIEFVGRRDPGLVTAPAPVAPPRRESRAPAWVRELAVCAAVVASVAMVRFAAGHVPSGRAPDPERDVFAQTQMRDLREAVELFARDRGEFPRRLEDMVEDRWLDPGQLRVPGYAVSYRLVDGGRDYDLRLVPDR